MYALIYRYADQPTSLTTAADVADFQNISGFVVVSALILLFLLGIQFFT